MKASAPKRFRWYDGILLRIIPPLSGLLVRALLFTCRVFKEEGLQREREAIMRAGGKVIYATWHQRMSFHARYFASRPPTIMISRSRDGEYAARIAQWLGFRTVRGSSSRGGLGALREMVKRVAEGEIGGVFADGPQGPARVAKMGVVLLAQKAQVPLIPVAWGADRCWVLNSWDRYLVPKPFARIAIFSAEPVWIPLHMKGDGLEDYRRLLEDRLNSAVRWCDEQFGAERPWRKATDESTPVIGPLPDA